MMGSLFMSWRFVTRWIGDERAFSSSICNSAVVHRINNALFIRGDMRFTIPSYSVTASAIKDGGLVY